MQPIVFSLGGSLVAPDGVDVTFVTQFRDMIMRYVEKGQRFVIVVGGGRTSRHYITSAAAIDPTMADEDKDWIGIHATRLNAHLLRTVFRTVAYPRVNDNPHNFEEFRSCAEPIVIGSGWRPGFSTDLDAVILGHHLGSDTVINLSNIDYVYTADPKNDPEAQPYKTLTWTQYRALFGSAWSPGMHAPFDPVAACAAQERAMRVAIINGAHLDRVDTYLSGGACIGTVIC